MNQNRNEHHHNHHHDLRGDLVWYQVPKRRTQLPLIKLTYHLCHQHHHPLLDHLLLLLLEWIQVWYPDPNQHLLLLLHNHDKMNDHDHNKEQMDHLRVPEVEPHRVDLVKITM